jgi:hypothetical protein
LKCCLSTKEALAATWRGMEDHIRSMVVEVIVDDFARMMDDVQMNMQL